MSFLKNIFSGGFIGLATTLGKAFNSAFEVIAREQDRQAGRNEVNLKQRVEQDESKKRAEGIYVRYDDNVIKQLRDKHRKTKD
ncbi:hypothetical protein OAF54_00920 [bacterium]|nr:hypothetical protein [bacterium]